MNAKLKKVGVLLLLVAAVSSVGCKKKKSGGADGDTAGGEDAPEVTAAVAKLPTEEDFEDEVEAKITAQNMDQEIAKIEDELKDTKAKAK